MANDLSIVKQFQDEISKLQLLIKELKGDVVSLSKASREVDFSGIKSPKGVNKALKETNENTEQLNALLKEQDRLEKNLINTQAKLTLATESTNRALVKERFELQQQNKLIKEAAVLSSRYSTQLQKATTIRNKLARSIQDLNLKRELGLKLSDKEQKELRESTKEFSKYDKSIKKAKNSVGRFQENVGNYPKLLGSITSLTTGLIGSFGVIEGLRLGFDFAKESLALAREAKGVEFAFKRLGSEGVDAFNNIKKSTRGLLSDLDIKRSLNEFNNFNISLEQTDTLFEFLAVRAAQTGRSVDSLKDSLVEGLSKESKLRIDNLGISAAKLNEELAKTPNFVEAVANIAKTEIAEAGDILDQAASSQEKFNAAYENLQVSIGSGGIGDFTNDFYELSTAIALTAKEINDASDGLFEFAVNAGLVAVGLGKVVEQRAKENNEEKKRADLLKEINKLQKERGLTQDQAFNIQTRLSQLTTENIEKVLESEKRRAKAIKSREEENKAIGKSVKQLRERITTLKQEQETLTINDLARSKAINNEIKKTEQLIKTILLLGEAREKIKPLSSELFSTSDVNKAKKELSEIKDLFDGEDAIKFPEIDTDSLDKLQEKIDKQIADAYQNLLDKELLDQAINDLGNTIEQFTGVSGDKFVDFFDKIRKGGIESFEDIAEVAQATFSLIGDISNAFFQDKIDEYQADIDANNAYYENLLQNETLTDEERKKIEKDQETRDKILRDKQKKEKEKQAVANKAFAIADITINTASAIVAALPNIPLSIAIGVLGAAQLATAIATPIPKFAEGGEMKHDGLMMINDHPSGRLEVVERDGKFLMTDKKNAFVEGKKGDIIHKDASQYFNGLSDKEILNNARQHSFLASISHQNYLANRANEKKTEDLYKVHADRIVKAISKQKTRITLKNNVSLGEELRYIQMSNQY